MRIASARNEGRLDKEEQGIVVVLELAQLDEIEGGGGGLFEQSVDDKVANRCFQENAHECDGTKWGAVIALLSTSYENKSGVHARSLNWGRNNIRIDGAGDVGRCTDAFLIWSGDSSVHVSADLMICYITDNTCVYRGVFKR